MTTTTPRFPSATHGVDAPTRSRRRPPRRPLTARLLRGRPGDPRWVRPALIGLLLATAVLYLWGLGASGWANSFYSAAVQAGSVSWKALFYGSLDAGNAITVDKTPASLWVMALSVRLFGLSAWSILAPQALMGMATVGVLYATVRRWFGPAAGLLAGTVLALTPVATLMFRFNNPDALLVLLLTLAAYATVRALERASTGWLVLAGSLIGLGFLTKMLQALLVVPALALVWLLAAPTRLRRRIGQLALAGLSLVVSAGWWVTIVELVPASARPYIGGSQTNSILELTLGYNGLGRLTGEEVGSVGPGGGGFGGGGPGGQTGWSRLFEADTGGQAAWLLPAALIALAAGLWVTWRAPRTDRTRAAFVLWGGWLLVTGLLFSFMQGIFHAYYTVALAPAIGALVGMGAAVLWRRRHHPSLLRRGAAAVTLAGTVAVTAAWSFVLLGRSPDWSPWLRVTVLVVGLAAAVTLLVMTVARAGRLARRIGLAAAAAGVLAVLAGPAAYSLQTAATPHGGAIPSAGPAVDFAGFGGPRGGPGPGDGGAPGGAARPDDGTARPDGGTTPPGGGTGPQGMPPSAGQRGQDGPSQADPGNGPGGMGGLLSGSTPSEELVALLQEDSTAYTWAAATVGANNSAGYQLATGDPVLALGGFNGTDPSPTLEQFQQYVRDGRIHYFIAGGSFGPRNGGSSASQQITEWVEQNFTATTVDGASVYDLTTAAA